MSVEPSAEGYLARGPWPLALVTYERIELPGGLSAPRRARRIARERLGRLLVDRRRHDLLVVVTELVTNAVRHAGWGDGETVVLHLAAAERVVRVEVCDDGPGLELVERDAAPRGGFGLLLLRRLPDRWGVSLDGGTSSGSRWTASRRARRRRRPRGGGPPRR